MSSRGCRCPKGLDLAVGAAASLGVCQVTLCCDFRKSPPRLKVLFLPLVPQFPHAIYSFPNSRMVGVHIWDIYFFQSFSKCGTSSKTCNLVKTETIISSVFQPSLRDVRVSYLRSVYLSLIYPPSCGHVNNTRFCVHACLGCLCTHTQGFRDRGHDCECVRQRVGGCHSPLPEEAAEQEAWGV